MSSSKSTLLVIFALTTYILGSCSTQISGIKSAVEDNLCTSLVCRNLTWTDKFKHCGTFIHECGVYTKASIKNQYSLQGFAFQYDPENSGSSTYQADLDAFLNKNKPDVTHQLISPPSGMSTKDFIKQVRENAKSYKAIAYWPYGPNSNSAADYPLHKSGAKTDDIEGALGLHHYHKKSELDEIKNNAVKLFYEYASSKTKDLIKQIKTQIIDQGSFKDLSIGDNKSEVVSQLQNLHAFYVSVENDSENGMIDLRNNKTQDINRLFSSNVWNVTYDEQGALFWSLKLSFDEDRLQKIDIKSSGLELP